jgi:hypothetical protein
MRKIIAAGTVALLLFSGCSKKDDTVKPDKKEETNNEAVEEVVSEKEFPYAFPLTGIGSEKEIEGRAISVMVNNHPEARQQSGLHKADIVFEMLAEGNITRFLAVFQSEKPESIGPVRSARDYYIELAKGLDSLFVAHGYSAEAQEMLENGYIDDLNGMVYDGTLFKRASFRKAPHNSYITYEDILKGAEQNNYSMQKAPKAYEFLTKKESENIAGEEAKSIGVSYSSNSLFKVQYQYDSELGKYKRFSNDEQTIDLDSKEQILLDNVLIVETDHAVVDDSGHKEIDLESGGEGYLLQKGKWNEVQWENNDGRIIPYLNGKEVPFVPGKTWINIIPTDPGLQTAVTFE